VLHFLINEYGADTVPGLHSDPSLMFTEEYQKGFYAAHRSVFDTVSTDQNIYRTGGLNYKGIFTRQRQPKRLLF
jgi:beta-glucuronidase